MIISHKHKFIYIKTRKTAGTSIEIALSSICGKNDIITPLLPQDEAHRTRLGFPGPQNYNIPFKQYTKQNIFDLFTNLKRVEFTNHMPCRDAIKYLDKNVWNSYFKFTVERNPFDKIISLYYWRLHYWRNSNRSYKNVLDFLTNGGLVGFDSYDIYSIDGIVAVDQIYRFEDLEFFLSDISMRLNLDRPLTLPQTKAKGHTRKIQNYRDVLDNESIEIIKTTFAREIKLLNYDY